MLRRCALFAWSLLPLALSAQPALEPFTADYTIRISIVRGTSVMTLRKLDEESYALDVQARARGVIGLFVRGGIDEQSRFAIRDGRAVPLEYRRTDTISKDARDVVLEFDWEAGRLVRRYDDTVEELPLPVNAVDPAMLPIALMVDLRAGRAPGPYELIERDHTETIDVSEADAEQLRTRAGSFLARKFIHGAAALERSTLLWAAEDFGHLMVRMEQYKGERLRASLELTAIEFDAQGND